MHTQLRHGFSDELDRKNLPPGQLAVDTERKALRVYDGELQGGYEVLGTRLVEPLPGPQDLIAGDYNTGFYGEVNQEDLITFSDLMAQVGVSQGTTHNLDQPWLKYSLDGEVVYVSKKTIRYSVSHDTLANAGVVYGGPEGQTITTPAGLQFRVRLLTGLDDSGTYTAGGEWNRLIYPVHSSDPTGQEWGINYTDADLGVAAGNGRASWIQETNPNDASRRVIRGLSPSSSVESLTSDPSGSSSALIGWRPVLEVVS